MYYLAAILLIGIGIVHSHLGERYILRRLFRKGDLPHLFGGPEFTKNTLRFAWHLTTVAWFGLAAILMVLAQPGAPTKLIGNIIALTFLLHFAIAILGSKGRHWAWIVFLLIGLAAGYAANV